MDSLLSAVKAELNEENYALHVDHLPDLEVIYPTLYGKDSNENFSPYPAGSQPEIDDLAFYLHSSGSTGFPKPIPQRYIHMLETCNSCTSYLVPRLDHLLTEMTSGRT